MPGQPLWEVGAHHADGAPDLQRHFGLKPLTAQLLANRGFTTADSAKVFLSPKLSEIRVPAGMADLDRAIDRIERALATGERVGVFGDYDVDGVTSAAILTETFRSLGGEVVPRVARRGSGYGFGLNEARGFIDEGCSVVVTGDCGTSDHASLAFCAEKGVDAIVIDHHQAPDGPNAAFAMINPLRPDDLFGFKGLASCGVAFYLSAALRSRLRARGNDHAERFDPRCLLDLVALGTVADMVPLVAENRILVAAGLKELAGWKRPGLKALAERAEMDLGVALSAEDISFRLTPRLNAPGRLGAAAPALDLLLAVTSADARRCAATVDDLNKDRQRIQEQVWKKALPAAEDELSKGRRAIVIGGEGWNPGVVGIVAARLVDRFQTPAVVIGFENGVGRGSGRTTGGFNLHQAFAAAKTHLEVWGGHTAAAGLTVRIDNLDAFRASFTDSAARFFAAGQTQAGPLTVDAVATLSELDVPHIEDLERLGPFGTGNPAPLLLISGAVSRRTKRVGNGHLQLSLSQEGAQSEAIAFGMADADPGEGAVLDVAAYAGIDHFRGEKRVRLKVKQLFPSQTSTSESVR